MTGETDRVKGVRQSSLLRWPPYRLEIVRQSPFLVLVPAPLLWEGREHSQGHQIAGEARHHLQTEHTCPQEQRSFRLARGTVLKAMAGRGSRQEGDEDRS